MALRVQLPLNEADRLLSVRSLISPPGHAAPELASLVELAKDVFDLPFAALNLVDEDWHRVSCQAGIHTTECPRDISICSRVVFANEVVVIPDLARHPELRELPYVLGGPAFRCYIGAPVVLEPDLPVGAFCLLDTKPRDFTDAEIRNLERFADIAGGLLRLHKAKLMMESSEQDLRLAAMTDPLTGFYNRAALEVLVDRTLDEAMAAQKPFGVLYLDMDGFKSINDQLGHHAGDEVLVQAAKRIRNCLNSNDVVVRMGGDEFAVFVPEAPDAAKISRLAHRLLEEFRRPFAVEGRIVSARLSIGGALAPDEGSDRLSLLRAVDEALYQAKAAGRDRFVFRQS
jgi:diguanylate cyclase (GGDEF)-like protein